MRRNIIKQGNNSFTLTLPIKWIRNNNLEGGDELFIDDSEDGLRIKLQEKHIKKTKKIDIKGSYLRTVKYIIQQLYRQGYDEITINYDSEQTFKIIEQVIENYFLGIEIIDKKPEMCKIAVIVETEQDKFNIFLRKIFQIIHESLSNISEKKELDKFESLFLKLNSYQNYCKRYLYNTKYNLSNYDHYSLLSYLLNIQADIDKLAKNIAKKKIVYDKNSIDNFRYLMNIYESIEKAFYKHDIKGLMDINKQIHEIIEKNYSKKSNFILHHGQVELFRLMYGAISPMLGILFQER